MTYCPECGERGRKNATFCDFCGAELPERRPEPRRVILSSGPRRLPGTPGLASICLGISVLIPGIGTVVSIFIQQHEINRFYNPGSPGDSRRTEE